MNEAERRGATYGEMVAYLVGQQLGFNLPEPGKTTDSVQQELPVRQTA